ncbi:hypothetical protein HCN51_20510 [Nonomuraea sp. FMUSA5-5]|uniref:Amidase domain-containing protein n=1 Tax=Nonomuraea composti TaxID=2720023 RepID=A0ABX1B5V4_9ACTN|nr:hypothetical protein [Nonomuraea sp. FMUSA5-5]
MDLGVGWEEFVLASARQETGLPIGMQFAAGYGREDLLFRLAGQLEQAIPWPGRTPAVWAGNGAPGHRLAIP